MEKLLSGDIDDIYDALIDIGNGGLKQYKNEVVKFLYHEEIDLRRAAVMILGTYWKEKDFIVQTKTISENDESALVRSTALMSWFFYFENTNNKEVLIQLFYILKENKEDILFLTEALRGIYVVSGNDINEKILRKLELSENHTEFFKMVPWEELQTILNKIIQL